MFNEVLINFNAGLFIIKVSHVAVVHIILINNRIKFLTQTSVALARLMDMLPAITLIGWNIIKMSNIPFLLNTCQNTTFIAYKIFSIN